MIKASLEKFNSPIVIISQIYEREDWAVIASYVSKQDAEEAGGKANFADIGWYVSIILPNLDDEDFDQVFSTSEDALEFGITQIVSGSFVSAASPVNELKGKNHPFIHYH